jgi:hypothetical protein
MHGNIANVESRWSLKVVKLEISQLKHEKMTETAENCPNILMFLLKFEAATKTIVITSRYINELSTNSNDVLSLSNCF